MISWSTRFKLWRARHRHISQGAFARILGVSRWTVINVETGKSKPSRITVQKFDDLEGRHKAPKVREWKLK